jgi:hypothetical protein
VVDILLFMASSPLRGNPNFRLLSSPPAQRARARFDSALAAEAERLRGSGLTLQEIATRFNRRGRRSWRGKKFSAQSVGLLLKRCAPQEES